jgi:tetraacyldisaccharide 4'-kinase
VLIGEDRTGAAAEVGNTLPVLHARLTPAPGIDPAGTDLFGRRVLAFAGIGRPEKFFDSVREAGAEIAEKLSFPDHHPYRAAEIDAILKQADDAGLLPVTTRKDWVRLPSDRRSGIAVLDITLTWQDEAALAALLAGLFTVRQDDV